MTTTKRKPGKRLTSREEFEKMSDTPRAWAWEIRDTSGRWVLCHWTEPSKAALRCSPPPSSEARPVCVRLVRNSKVRP